MPDRHQAPLGGPGSEASGGRDLEDLRRLVKNAATPAERRQALETLARREQDLRRQQAWAAIAELRELREELEAAGS